MEWEGEKEGKKRKKRWGGGKSNKPRARVIDYIGTPQPAKEQGRYDATGTGPLRMLLHRPLSRLPHWPLQSPPTTFFYARCRLSLGWVPGMPNSPSWPPVGCGPSIYLPPTLFCHAPDWPPCSKPPEVTNWSKKVHTLRHSCWDLMSEKPHPAIVRLRIHLPIRPKMASAETGFRPMGKSPALGGFNLEKWRKR